MRLTTTRRLGFLSLLGAFAAVAATLPPQAQNPSGRPVRILLGSAPREVPLAQPGAWRLLDATRRVVARGENTDKWSVMRDGRRLRAVFADAPASEWIDGPLTIERTNGSDVSWQQKAYRGALVYVATDSALLIINRVEIEEYLKSVVPLEIGGRLTSDHAAV